MQRLFVLFVAMIVLVSGCAMYQAKRDFLPDNVFACNMPSLKVQLSSDFIYTGAYDKRREGKSTTDPLETPTTKVVDEFFVWQTKDKSKLVVIRLATLKDPRWYWTGSGFHQKFRKQYKVQILGGDKWNTLIQHNWKMDKLT